MNTRGKFVILTSSFPSQKDKSQGLFIYNRALIMKKTGIDVEVWLMHSILKGGKLNDYRISLHEDDSAINVRVFNSVKFPKTYIWMGYRKLRGWIRTSRVRGFLIHFAWDAWLANMAKKHEGIPYSITCHGSDIHTFPDKSFLFNIWTKKFMKNADGLIFVSEYLRQIAIKRKYKTNNSIVIHNGIYRDVYTLHKNIKKRESNIILFVGNLYAIKGADRLAELLQETVKLVPDVTLWIVGTGPLEQDLRSKFQKLGLQGRVKWWGRVPPSEIPNIMNSGNALVVPSRKEGFPSVVMEARACGLPVVATETAGIPEAVENAGMLVREGDNYNQRFAQKIQTCLNMEWDSNQIRKETSHLDWRITVSKECEYYEDIFK